MTANSMYEHVVIHVIKIYWNEMELILHSLLVEMTHNSSSIIQWIDKSYSEQKPVERCKKWSGEHKFRNHKTKPKAEYGSFTVM